MSRRPKKNQKNGASSDRRGTGPSRDVLANTTGDASVPKTTVSFASEKPDLESSSAGLTGPQGGLPLWKRSMDLGLLLLWFPFYGPLMLLLWVAIKLISPGPAFFNQKRIGYRGQPFRCFKFRTMEHNAEVKSHVAHMTKLVARGVPLKKMDRDDPRLVPLGKWIRAAGLDELPQVWNIIRGEMSLVGPRPCADYEFPFFVGEDLKRFNVTPGLTGLWQVSGKNGTTFDQMIYLDLQYSRNCSFSLDLKILTSTPAIVVAQVLQLNRYWPGPDSKVMNLPAATGGLSNATRARSAERAKIS